MRITIKGLTASTIAFNSIGIILRGDSSLPEQYPESIANGVPVNNMPQIEEVLEMKRAKIITVELVDAENSPYVYLLFPELAVPEEEKVPEEETETEAKRGRGRPKGSKNKTKTGESKTKMVKRSTKTTPQVTPDEVTPDEDTAIVMTEDGVRKTQTIKEEDKVLDLDENDRTSASIEALRQLEEEEKQANEAEDIVVDESKLDPSERKGGTAVIGTGGNATKSVEMKNSIIPEAEEIQKRDPFIKDDTPEVDTEAAFIDKDKDDGKDHFIEC